MHPFGKLKTRFPKEEADHVHRAQRRVCELVVANPIQLNISAPPERRCWQPSVPTRRTVHQTGDPPPLSPSCEKTETLNTPIRLPETMLLAPGRKGGAFKIPGLSASKTRPQPLPFTADLPPRPQSSPLTSELQQQQKRSCSSSQKKRPQSSPMTKEQSFGVTLDLPPDDLRVGVHVNQPLKPSRSAPTLAKLTSPAPLRTLSHPDPKISPHPMPTLNVASLGTPDLNKPAPRTLPGAVPQRPLTSGAA